MKRLLCINNCMNVGGAETFIMKLFRNLDHSKYVIDFCINVYEKNDYEDEINALGGKIYRIPSKSSDFSGYKKQLYQVIKENKYDNVLRITSNAAGLLDLKIAKRAGAKWCVARSSNASDGDSNAKLLLHKISRCLFMKHVDAMVAPSDLAAKYTFGEKNFNSGKVKILKNGLDVSLFKFDKVYRDDIREELNLKDRFVIGHVGRFFEQKNHDFLIEIFNEYHKINNNGCLVLVGVGELELKIKEKVKKLGLEECVKFLGLRNDVSKLLNSFDVFLFPSLFEGMPNTVIEAQCNGLPCLIADSITREAAVTDLVRFKSLDCSAQEWAESLESLGVKDIHRELYSQKMKENEYDIKSVCIDFEEIMFKY